MKSSAAWSLNAAIAGSNCCDPMLTGGSVAGLSYWFHRQQPVGDSDVGNAPASRLALLEMAGTCIAFADVALVLVLGEFRCPRANGITQRARSKSR